MRLRSAFIYKYDKSLQLSMYGPSVSTKHVDLSLLLLF